MTLKAENPQHQNQIEAGRIGRINGHEFEYNVYTELNQINLKSTNLLIKSKSNNIYKGNPAAALIDYISIDKGKQIERLKAYWLGGLATAGEGDTIYNEAGNLITGSKSDVIIDVTYSTGEKECIGISAKSCSHNPQINLTTAHVFCDMLRKNKIQVSEDAENGLKMFCGDSGFSPKDNYIPNDASNIPADRQARPERWFWEEIPTSAQLEWEEIFTKYQDEITILLLQKANAYKEDTYKPTYILHECIKHQSIDDCQVVVISMKDFANYSKKFDGFGIKEQRILKGHWKDIDLAIHKYPHFGFIQFQPIGNKQNFSELQFNLKQNYYKTFENYKKK